MLAGWYILTICWCLHIHFKTGFSRSRLKIKWAWICCYSRCSHRTWFLWPNSPQRSARYWLPYGQDSAILVKVLEKITLGVAEGTCGIRLCFHWQEQSNKHYNSGCAGFVKDPANDDKNTNFNFIIFPSLEVLFS